MHKVTSAGTIYDYNIITAEEVVKQILGHIEIIFPPPTDWTVSRGGREYMKNAILAAPVRDAVKDEAINLLEERFNVTL